MKRSSSKAWHFIKSFLKNLFKFSPKRSVWTVEDCRIFARTLPFNWWENMQSVLALHFGALALFSLW